MIANLIFTVILRQIKEAESFSAVEQMASVNIVSFLRFFDVLKIRKWCRNEKNTKIIQFVRKLGKDSFQNLIFSLI
jgi:hypothetical protein